MSAQSPPAPTAAERARAHAMVDGDERRARIAWSRVLEPRRERPGLPLTRLEVALHEIGYTTAWHRLVDGDLPRAESARAHVPAVDVDAELSRVTRSRARVVVPGDADWPTALDHPLIRPHLIHVRGQGCLADLTQRAVAVVGSRAGTCYGEAVARELGSGIARSGWTVVSGAAFGIDAAAHQGGLVVDGPGVAVLPCGPDRTYPVSNQRLVDAVAESGAVVTELATGTVARRHRFLARNRLIAALSRCCIVVEAGLRSGSLNTAGWAEALHLPVGAVPGPVTQMSSAGCNEWIQKTRAGLVADTGDVLALAGSVGDAPDEVAELLGPARPLDALTAAQRGVHDLLSLRQESAVGDLATELVLPVEEVIAILSVLQIEGWVAQGESGGWLRTPAG